jgi:hypothetical protein
MSCDLVNCVPCFVIIRRRLEADIEDVFVQSESFIIALGQPDVAEIKEDAILVLVNIHHQTNNILCISTSAQPSP